MLPINVTELVHEQELCMPILNRFLKSTVTVWNTGETGDINCSLWVFVFPNLSMLLHCFRQNTECISYLLSIATNTNSTFTFQCIVIKKNIYYKRNRER